MSGFFLFLHEYLIKNRNTILNMNFLIVGLVAWRAAIKSIAGCVAQIACRYDTVTKPVE